MFRLIVKTFLFFFFLLLLKFNYAQTDRTFSIIKEVKIIGNKTTKSYIIHRELPFNIGDTISSKDLKKIANNIKSNLLNTSLFNFVTVDIADIDPLHIAFYITIEERWYWWPVPIFEVEETNFNTWLENKNLNRANYGLFLAKENFRGRKERLVFKFQAGYTEQIEIRYHAPYINKSQTQGITLGLSYRQNNELIYGTTDNRRDFIRLNDTYVKKSFLSKINYEYRPKLYNKFNLELQYTDVSVRDTVVKLNNDFLVAGNNSIQFLSLVYSLKRDKRNLKSYATKGHYLDLTFVKNGLGIIDKELNSFYITSTIKKYWQLTDKVYLASSIKGKATLRRPPYLLLDGFGYKDDLVRGYERYVINGEHYGLFKSQLRYALFNDVFKTQMLFSKFNKVPISIYAGLFFDAGYAIDNEFEQTNFLNNELLYGSGVSIDFVSYYDLVFRVEYSINALKRHGIFLHFLAPI